MAASVSASLASVSWPMSWFLMRLTWSIWAVVAARDSERESNSFLTEAREVALRLASWARRRSWMEETFSMGA